MCVICCRDIVDFKGRVPNLALQMAQSRSCTLGFSVGVVYAWSLRDRTDGPDNPCTHTVHSRVLKGLLHHDFVAYVLEKKLCLKEQPNRKQYSRNRVAGTSVIRDTLG